MRAVDVPIFGRDEEMATRASLGNGQWDGRGRLACIKGVAGIGKTTLVQATSQVGSKREFPTFNGAGTEFQRTAPFGR